MVIKIWDTSSDGQIEYKTLTSKHLNSVLEVMQVAFYPYEPGCIACGVRGNPAAIAEVNSLIIKAVKDGVSIVAVEKDTERVIGVAVNKLHIKNSSDFYDVHTKTEAATNFINFYKGLDDAFDLFELCDGNCVMEIMFLATLPEFRGRGIGITLCRVSVELAKLFSEGENVTHNINGVERELETVPKTVVAYFTSEASQKLGRKLNFNIAQRIRYENFSCDGESFDKILGSEYPFVSLEYQRL